MTGSAKLQKTILLLDDEEIELSTNSAILQGQGYIVLEAESYDEAVLVFESARDQIDLLIADISLPDRNGCELALALVEKRSDLRVLFVSGHVGAEVCRFYGLDITDLHFLAKPFTKESLIARVNQVLESKDPLPRRIPKTRTA